MGWPSSLVDFQVAEIVAIVPSSPVPESRVPSLTTTSSSHRLRVSRSSFLRFQSSSQGFALSPSIHNCQLGDHIMVIGSHWAYPAIATGSQTLHGPGWTTRRDHLGAS